MKAARSTAGPLLVVDDDRLVLLTVAHGLRQAGYEVMEADNGDDAILLARRHHPALAVLDIRMQGLSGFDVAQHLRDYSRIPFLFLSAYADDRAREQAQALGALACLGKPVALEQLLPVIEAGLDRSQASHAQVATADPVDPPGPDGLGDPDWPPIPIALGMLMHRHGLTREAALQRLEGVARLRGIPVASAARDLLAAHEVLAGTGPIPG